MSPETTLMIAIPVALGVLWVIRHIARMRPEPDPWDGHGSESGAETTDVPVCTKCLASIAGEDQHYCPNCGNATGGFTRYVPFVNIRFNYSLFATLWGRLKDPGASVASKVVSGTVILLTTPLMLLFGLPFLVYGSRAAASVRLALASVGAIVALWLFCVFFGGPLGMLTPAWTGYVFLAMTVLVGLLGNSPAAWRWGRSFAAVAACLLVLALLLVAFREAEEPVLVVPTIVILLHLGANFALLFSLGTEGAREHFGVAGSVPAAPLPSGWPEEPSSPTWRCPCCGRDVPATFDECWNCQTSAPPDAETGASP